MELELATAEDIAQELLKRQIRFAFVAIEDTNSSRAEFACFSGKGTDAQDVSNLFRFGRKMLEADDDEPGI